MSCRTDWPTEQHRGLHDACAAKLLEPGWGGDLDDVEVGYIQGKLLEDQRLAYQWGFAPSNKTRPAEGIRRVGMDGDPVRRSVNLRLARPKVSSKHAGTARDTTIGRPNSKH